MKARRTDANHGKIREALRDAGYIVHDLANLGLPVDLGVQNPAGGFPLFLECKDGSKPPSRRKVTELGQKWAELTKDQTMVVLSPAEAIAECNDFFYWLVWYDGVADLARQVYDRTKDWSKVAEAICSACILSIAQGMNLSDAKRMLDVLEKDPMRATPANLQ